MKTIGDIFISRRIFDEYIKMLEKAGHNVEVNDSSEILSKKELIRNTKNKDGLICLLNDKIDEEFLNACSNLRVVANAAVGYDNIDLETANEKGVIVTNTPGVLTDTTADLAFTLLMSAARRIPEADNYSREGKYDGWELMQPHMGVDIHGKTLGILGMGRIGSAVARRGAAGFEMDIIYHDKYSVKEDLEKEIEAERVDFEDLLIRSDFLSIHTPLTEETEGMFKMEEFRKINSNCILINAARGPIVDEDDLAQAIEEGELRGAAVDTFENEPKVNPRLANLTEFVVLTPHIGSASLETRREMARLAAINMIAGLEGKKPPNIVNEEILSGK